MIVLSTSHTPSPSRGYPVRSSGAGLRGLRRDILFLGGTQIAHVQFPYYIASHNNLGHCLKRVYRDLERFFIVSFVFCDNIALYLKISNNPHYYLVSRYASTAGQYGKAGVPKGISSPSNASAPFFTGRSSIRKSPRRKSLRWQRMRCFVN